MMTVLFFWVNYSRLFLLTLTLQLSPSQKVEQPSENRELSHSGSAKRKITSSKHLQHNHRSDGISHFVNHLIQLSFYKHKIWRHLLKWSKLWKATMAPILWHGGDSAPSRKSSLPWRRIAWNSPESFTGTDNLRGGGDGVCVPIMDKN